MFYWLLKGVLKPILLGVYRIRAEGLKNVPRSGPAVIAANHLSFLDSFFIPLVIKWRRVTYLAKSEYFKSWKIAWFFRAAGQIPTEREGGRGSHALRIALDVLRQGKLLGIYPEGTRSPDGCLHKGRTGAARLAVTAGVPVIPCGVIGTDEVMPKAARFPRLRGRLRVTVRFGTPLDFSAYAGKERDVVALRAMTDKIMQEIRKLSGQEYKEEYAPRTLPEASPETRRLPDEDDIDLSEEIIVG